jgi:carboxymethylenebutenolidase
MVLVGEKLESGTIQYTSRDGTQVNAFYSRPAGPGSYPGVIVTMEGMGLMEHHKDIARRFAGQGFLAIAPDLYTRQGTPDPSNMDEVIKTLMSVPDSQAMDDLDGAAVHLKNQAHCNGKVGIIGFCSGGRYTLMMACQSSNIAAAVDSAGGNIVHETSPLRPVQPIDMVPNLSCPLLALFGIEDDSPSPEQAERMKALLDEHGKTYEWVMYENAGHAFFADYRPSYRAVPAQDMWHRVLLFYDKHLRV